MAIRSVADASIILMCLENIKTRLTDFNSAHHTEVLIVGVKKGK